MSERFINFKEELGMNANVKLRDVLQEVDFGDELIITMDRNAADHSDALFDMLKENGFEVLPKGGHDDDKYHIIAQKKK